MKRTVLVVGAHADDIEINIGDTLSKHCRRGAARAFSWVRRTPIDLPADLHSP